MNRAECHRRLSIQLLCFKQFATCVDTRRVWITVTIEITRNYEQNPAKTSVACLFGNATQAVESKWSDACANNLGTIKSLCKFLRQHPSCSAVVTSRSLSAKRTIEGRTVPFIPSAVYCYFIGKITTADRRDSMLGVSVDNAESST